MIFLNSELNPSDLFLPGECVTELTNEIGCGVELAFNLFGVRGNTAIVFM